MSSNQLSLARQVDLALEKLGGELKGMSAGTIVLQIRDDSIGRFGIRHLPVDCADRAPVSAGMTAEQVLELRQLAIEALKHKSGWTHGEICYDFLLKQGRILVSVQSESNYNMELIALDI
ncbi:O-methyltransferase [Cohnella cellulosilytica]|uniref:O-methyltransferase n=1 Tax=Cohnella cellulosilytica TaxID=986710 RepID=A0ABW2FKY0_9BACL